MEKMFAVKKPVKVEVMQYTGTDSLPELLLWIGSKASYNGIKNQLLIETLEGTMVASLSDYIVKGVHGEFYPVKESIFNETYDIVVLGEEFYDTIKNRN
ncbi:hypothetical protein Alsa2_CDS0182 [Staphylococcus phage Alsa_2]|nr:hypothetical protein Alsa2_CDS0182 [Staphylococcus phage Alsa_2]